MWIIIKHATFVSTNNQKFKNLLNQSDNNLNGTIEKQRVGFQIESTFVWLLFYIYWNWREFSIWYNVGSYRVINNCEFDLRSGLFHNIKMSKVIVCLYQGGVSQNWIPKCIFQIIFQ